MTNRTHALTNAQIFAEVNDNDLHAQRHAHLDELMALERSGNKDRLEAYRKEWTPHATTCLGCEAMLNYRP